MQLAAKVATITLVLGLLDQQVCSRKIYAYFEALECSNYNPNYAESVKCWLGQDHTGQLTMNAALKLKKDLTNISNKFRFIIERRNSNVTFLSAEIDICSALGAALTNPVLRLISEEIRRISNLPLECPLKKEVEYGIYNYTIITKYIPAFTPQMKWIAYSEYFTNTTKERLLEYVCSGRVVHTKPKINFKK